MLQAFNVECRFGTQTAATTGTVRVGTASTASTASSASTAGAQGTSGTAGLGRTVGRGCEGGRGRGGSSSGGRGGLGGHSRESRPDRKGSASSACTARIPGTVSVSLLERLHLTDHLRVRKGKGFIRAPIPGITMRISRESIEHAIFDLTLVSFINYPRLFWKSHYTEITQFFQH